MVSQCLSTLFPVLHFIFDKGDNADATHISRERREARNGSNEAPGHDQRRRRDFFGEQCLPTERF